MSSILKDVEELEETLKQINLEKSNLIEHLKKQDDNFISVVKDLQTVYTSKIDNLKLEIEKLRFALSKSEGDEEPLVFKLE